MSDAVRSVIDDDDLLEALRRRDFFAGVVICFDSGVLSPDRHSRPCSDRRASAALATISRLSSRGNANEEIACTASSPLSNSCRDEDCPPERTNGVDDTFPHVTIGEALPSLPSSSPPPPHPLPGTITGVIATYSLLVRSN